MERAEQARVEEETRAKHAATFLALKPKQEIELAMRACMGHGPSETGTYTPMVVGRRTKSAKYGVEMVHLLLAGGRKPHPGRKVTLYYRRGRVDVAIGDMGATLIDIRTSVL